MFLSNHTTDRSSSELSRARPALVERVSADYCCCAAILISNESPKNPNMRQRPNVRNCNAYNKHKVPVKKKQSVKSQALRAGAVAHGRNRGNDRAFFQCLWDAS
eukprot:2969030-Pleurochrysis_carterae.AAC.1